MRASPQLLNLFRDQRDAASSLQPHPALILSFSWAGETASSNTFSCCLLLNIQYQEKGKQMISPKKKNLLLPLVLVQPYVSVGPVEWLSFSPGYSVPQNILTCIHCTAPSFPWVQSTGLHQWKETQPFSIVHFMNRMNYIHLASLWSLVSGMSILLLEDKWNRLGEQQF